MHRSPPAHPDSETRQTAVLSARWWCSAWPDIDPLGQSVCLRRGHRCPATVRLTETPAQRQGRAHDIDADADTDTDTMWIETTRFTDTGRPVPEAMTVDGTVIEFSSTGRAKVPKALGERLVANRETLEPSSAEGDRDGETDDDTDAEESTTGDGDGDADAAQSDADDA